MKEELTKAQLLKKEILAQYRSVRQFAAHMGIPYSTLVTALERGIDGMAYETVMDICAELALNPIDFRPLSSGGDLSSQIMTRKVMDRYSRFNKAGKKRILEVMDEYSKIEEYTKEDI